MTPERELAIYATGVVIAIVVACVAIVWLIAPAAAQAQSAEAQARAAINAKGYECPEVTVAQGVAMVSNGDALIGAACSNGERFVLQY
jgi:hypothetical protein